MIVIFIAGTIKCADTQGCWVLDVYKDYGFELKQGRNLKKLRYHTGMPLFPIKVIFLLSDVFMSGLDFKVPLTLTIPMTMCSSPGLSE